MKVELKWKRLTFNITGMDAELFAYRFVILKLVKNKFVSRQIKIVKALKI